MSGATFPRVKVWTTEALTSADLNAEFNNILNNLLPSGMDDYSSSVATMRLSTDPGEIGTESQATSLAGELERIRFALKEIKGSGVSYWYETSSTSLSDIISAIGGSIASNRIVSGTKSSNSNAPRFLVAHGSTATVTLDAAPTAFVYYINGSQVTLTADKTYSSLQCIAGTANNTCLVDDTNLTGQEYSKWVGEDGTELIVDTMGSGISNTLIGSYQGFKIVSGGSTEHMVAYVKSTTRLSNCLRGAFFNSAMATMPRIPISDNNTITLTQLNWMFVNTTGALAASAVNPTISYATPSSTSGYWFDYNTTAWKTYNGAAWVTAGATLIGVASVDQSACIGARGFDFFGNYEVYNNIVLDYVTATTVQARNYGSKIGVGTSVLDFKMTKPQWNIANDLEAGYTESASNTYFAYVGENAQIKFSPEKPYYSPQGGRGWYHPYELWRAIGSIKNDGSSNFDKYTMFNYPADQNSDQSFVAVDDLRNLGGSVTVNASAMIVTIHSYDGTELSIGNPGYAVFRGAQTAGVTVQRKITDNLNMTVPQGATLGCIGGMSQYQWTYLTDSNGTIDVAICGQVPNREMNMQPTTQITSGATAAGTLYSRNASAASLPIRYILRTTTNNATAANWVSAPSSVALKPPFESNIEMWNDVVRTCALVSFTVIAGQSYATRRVGDTLEVSAYAQVTATGTGAAIQLPTGLTADATKLVSAGPVAIIGEFWALSSGGGTSFISNTAAGTIWFNSSASAVNMEMGIGAISKGFQQANASTLVPAGATWGIGFSFRVPIKGWSSYGP